VKGSPSLTAQIRPAEIHWNQAPRGHHGRV